MDLPDFLLNEIRDGHVVLFLGAGASIGATGTGELSRMPDGEKLRDLLCDWYLGGDDKNLPLSVVAEYAISTADLVEVQSKIRDLLLQFEPADFHKKLSKFRWAAIATTNYDINIEKAYEQSKDSLQELIRVVKTTDKFEQEARKPNTVLYLKLHGCITRATDPAIPLILTIDQYVSYRKSRERLFDRFKSFATDAPVIFVGYRLTDPNLRQILTEITEEGNSRPRYYVVAPDPNPRDVQIWEQKKISVINGTFEAFVNEISSKIPEAFRAIQTQSKDHLIEARFIKHQKLSPTTLSFVRDTLDYLHPGFVTEVPNPKIFYKGASYNWSAIAGELDAKRHLADTVLTDVVLADEADRPQQCDFYLIKGYAGSGKSVLLRRIAWDAANQYDKLCLYYKADTQITIEPIQEICELTGERVFIFIDRLVTRSGELERFVKSARQRKLRVTVICCERTAEWNTDCQNLSQLTDETYELKSLSEREVERVLEKLSKYGQLGNLQKMTLIERKNAFMEYANRQLLVALYEVTSGLPFEQIVFDEYRNIVPDQARHMYLVICSLNRLGVLVRAGIIKRLTGISFADFKERFFQPLESIVLTENYKPALDIVYRARHPWIAEKVFERALPNPIDRYDHYLKLLEVLDVGYSPDRQAFRELIRAKSLLKIFPDPALVRELYKMAEKYNGDSAYLHQQIAIFEMNRANGNFEVAHAELKLAQEIAPHDKSIRHSFAELEMARAQQSSTQLEREKHLRAAKDIGKTLTGTNAETSHGYVTVAKAGLDTLGAALKTESPDEHTITLLVKEIESYIQTGLEHFPDDEFLLSAESNLAELLNNENRAVAALEKAFKTNSASPFIARSLCRLYEKRGKLSEAKSVLESCLGILPGDKSVNAVYARFLSEHHASEGPRIAVHWRRSFTDGDTNYSSHYWYARQLFLNGNFPESKIEFKKLRTARVSSDMKYEVKGLILNADDSPKLYRGTVDLIEATYARFRSETDALLVTLNRSKCDVGLWSKLQSGQKVEFTVGFNFHGTGVANFKIL